MPVSHKEDWQAWHDEIKRYQQLGTEGLDKDLATLADHIDRLGKVAPKDKAGGRHTDALIYLNSLQMRLNAIKSYLSRV
ncbi:hypothetical protein ES703_13918 [subsurface metagenome]